MGIAPSTQNIIKSETNIISNTIMKSVQKANNIVGLTQQISLACNKYREILAPAYLKCLDDFKNHPQQIAICAPYIDYQCKLVNVDLKQYVNANVNTNQENTIITTINNDLTKSIRSEIADEFRLLNLSGQTLLSIQELANLTTDIFAKNIQTIMTSLSGKQSIEVEGGVVELVSLQQAIDYVGKFLQQNESWLRASNDLSLSIRADIIAQNSTLNLVLYIGIGVIFLVLAIVLIVIFVQKLKKKSAS
jgi:hypothetical protein